MERHCCIATDFCAILTGLGTVTGDKDLCSTFMLFCLLAGHYVTRDVNSEYLEVLERSTRSKTRALAEDTKQQSTEALAAAR